MYSCNQFILTAIQTLFFVFIVTLFICKNETIGQFEPNLSVIRRSFEGPGKDKGKDINIGIIQVKLKNKPTEPAPLMNFSRGAFPMQNPKLAGQSGLNTSIHQREHFVRPIKYLWMREIEQMFGTYLFYFLIGFAFALLIFFIILYFILHALLKQRKREKNIESFNKRPDEDEFGEEWEEDEDENEVDDDEEDFDSQHYHQMTSRKHVDNYSYPIGKNKLMPRNSGYSSAENRFAADRHYQKRWEMAMSRQYPLPPPPSIRPPQPPVPQRYLRRRDGIHEGNFSSDDNEHQNLHQNRSENNRPCIQRQASDSTIGTLRTRTGSL